MAAPLQEPKIALPGAEFFALAPGRDILIGPRLFSIVGSATINVAASALGQAQVNFPINPNWSSSDGFFLVRGIGLYAPGDIAGELQIVQARMGVGQPPTNIFLDLGIPTATFSSPPNAQVAIFERDALITFVDTGPNFPINTSLNMIFQMTVKNLDTTNPHSFTLTGTGIWHNLRGFVQ